MSKLFINLSMNFLESLCYAHKQGRLRDKFDSRSKVGDVFLLDIHMEKKDDICMI